MRGLLLICFLCCPALFCAQDQPCTILGVQELTQIYQDLIDAHAELQAQFALLRGIEETNDNGDGTITFTFTDGTIYTTEDLTGPTGADGVGLQSVLDNEDGTLTLTLTDGGSSTITLVTYGCIDPNYLEYDIDANVSDGSCTTLRVEGCMNSNYLEYAPSANVEDGSCSTPIVLGCTDDRYVEYNAAANVDDGSCLNWGSECAPVAMDGHDYSVIQIGDQCWFAEDLRTSVYADGTPIPEVTGGDAWADLSSAARSHYNNVETETRGTLYNGYAVMQASGVCPAGWHVPSDADWTALESHIQGNQAGSMGTLLKAKSGWNNQGNGLDSFEFNALPGGYRGYSNGAFYFSGSHGAWWSSTESEGGAWGRFMYDYSSSVSRSFYHPRGGLSIRCLKNSGG